MWTSRKKRPGFTVIEVLVFSTILSLLMGSIVLVVQGGLRYMRKGAAYQDAQKETLVAMRKLSDDLSKSSSSRRDPLSPIVDSPYVIFLSPEPPPVPPPGTTPWTYKGDDLEYHAWICYAYDSTTREVVRYSIPIDPPLPSQDLADPPPLSDFTKILPGPDRKVIARDISEFAINDGLTGQQLILRIASSIETGTGKNTTVVSRSMVTMPNP